MRPAARRASDGARLSRSSPRLVHARPLLRAAAASSSASSSSAASTPPESSTPRRVGSLAATPGVPFILQLIGAATLLSSGAYIYRATQRDKEEKGKKSLLSSRGQIFTVPVDGVTPDKEEEATQLEMLSHAQTDARLRENEYTFSVRRKGNPVYRYDTNSVSSNNPVEDDYCSTILQRDSSTGEDGDLLFFGIFDGHAGWQTSRLLSSQLVQYVARELHSIFEGHLPEGLPSSVSQSLSNATVAAKGQVARVWDLVAGAPASDAEKTRHRDLSSNPAVVNAAIRLAFKKLDSDIVNAPIRMLEEREQAKGSEAAKENGKKSGLATSTAALQTLLPALSGSCALLAYVDTLRHRLHVACTGDSRAVMGVWEPSKSIGEVGKWRTVLLTDDQTGRNESELKRMRSEHPASERDRVIFRGRVLGGLEPTRAFGDARYKWPLGTQQKLMTAFMPEGGRGPPAHYETPPYVTADPVVTSVPLREDLPLSKGRQFIILATDGLWDRISSEHAVALVGAWLDGERGIKTVEQVHEHIHSGPKALGTGWVPAPDTKLHKQTFEDVNASTHLIRNALGGGDRQQVSALLSIPAPLSRRYRDDITVQVIFLGERPTPHHAVDEPEGVRRVVLSAKL